MTSSDDLLRRAIASLLAGRLNDALAAYREVLALKPDLVAAWIGCGKVFYDLDRYDEALAALDKALALEPKFAEAMMLRSYVLADLERFGEAIIAYRGAFALKSELYDIYLDRPKFLANLKRNDLSFRAPIINTQIPFFVLHYAPESHRRAYIEREWQLLPERVHFRMEFVTSHDREQPSVKMAYAYDENLYRKMIQQIKDLQCGYLIADRFPNASFKKCVDWYRSRNLTLDQCFQMHPWLRPRPLTLGDVSLILKHQEVWTRIAKGNENYAVIAEDDIIFTEQSLNYLLQLINDLPQGAEYIDIAGAEGGTWLPRADNKLVNKRFYEIDPPKTRTTCAAILTRSFARKLIDLNAPICLGIDWMLNWAFMQLGTKVYWVEPTVFGHGSMMKMYESLREAEHRE
jgi:tetratricopeptide (TPR) repeat protein